jgi:hypothetical protein
LEFKVKAHSLLLNLSITFNIYLKIHSNEKMKTMKRKNEKWKEGRKEGKKGGRQGGRKGGKLELNSR